MLGGHKFSIKACEENKQISYYYKNVPTGRRIHLAPFVETVVEDVFFSVTLHFCLHCLPSVIIAFKILNPCKIKARYNQSAHRKTCKLLVITLFIRG